MHPFFFGKILSGSRRATSQEMATEDWEQISDGPRGGKRWRNKKTQKVTHKNPAGGRKPRKGKQTPTQVQQPTQPQQPVEARPVEAVKKPPVEMEVVADEAVGQAEDALGQIPPESFNDLRRRLGETAGGNKAQMKKRMAGKIYEEFEVWSRGQKVSGKDRSPEGKRDTRSWGRFLQGVIGGTISGVVGGVGAVAGGVGSLIDGIKRRI